jgi:hypothetical protein
VRGHLGGIVSSEWDDAGRLHGGGAVMKFARDLVLTVGTILILVLLISCAASSPTQSAPKASAPKTASRVHKPSATQIAALAAVPATATVKGPSYEELFTAADVEQATGLTGLACGPSG